MIELMEKFKREFLFKNKTFMAVRRFYFYYKESFIAYIKSILITLLCVFFSTISLLIFVGTDDFIDLNKKNKYLVAENPNDFTINLQLGVLYEIKKDYIKAEEEYKQAVMKAPQGEDKPIFRLASFYANTGRLKLAENIFDGIKDKPQKTLIKQKAEFFNKLGDLYYELGSYNIALEKYTKSTNYCRGIKDKAYLEFVNKNIASTYVYLAQEYINNNQINEAVEYLKNCDKLVDSPIIKYQLALLLSEVYPQDAYEYFKKVLKEEPSLVNFDIYTKFLNEYAKIEEENGNIAQAKLLRYKAQKYEQFYEKNILLVNDVEVMLTKGYVFPNKRKRQYEITFAIKLRNNSSANIEDLFLTILLKDGDKLINQYKLHPIEKLNPLYKGYISHEIKIEDIYKFKKEDKI